MIYEKIKDSLKENSITAEQFYILDLLAHDKESLYPYLQRQLKFKNTLIRNLYRRNFIEIPEVDIENIGLSTNIKLTDKALEIVEEEPLVEDLTWFKDWYELWPAGVKSGGYYVRSGERDCLKKMKSFMKKYKYTPEEIMKATNNYLNTMAAKGFDYMKLATNFIDKDGVSSLAAECEALSSNRETQSFIKDV